MMERIESRKKIWFEKYKQATLETFPKKIQEILELQTEIIMLENPDENIFLTGKSGTGKTTHIYRRILRWQLSNFCRNHQTSYIFKKVPVLLEEIRAVSLDIDKKRELLESLKNTKLLILDDIGSCRLSDHASEMLYIIIDYRYEEEKTMWFSSNFDLQTMSLLDGDDRIIRRIASACKDSIIQFTNKPYI